MRRTGGAGPGAHTGSDPTAAERRRRRGSAGGVPVGLDPAALRSHGSAEPPLSGAGDSFEIVQGLRAGLAVFTRRSRDLVRVAHARAVRGEIAQLARWASLHRVPCIEAPDRELDRLAGSRHHEGLCVVARPRRWSSAAEIGDALTRRGGAAVALDRVRNPYNVGAILRTAAFFGLEGAIVGGAAPSPDLDPIAVRVAEGGAEDLRLARTTDLAETLARLRSAGVQVFGAEVRGETDSLELSFGRPALLVVGHERQGLEPRVRARCDRLVSIGSGGPIDSLNVAVAAGILIAAMAGRRH